MHFTQCLTDKAFLKVSCIVCNHFKQMSFLQHFLILWSANQKCAWSLAYFCRVYWIYCCTFRKKLHIYTCRLPCHEILFLLLSNYWPIDKHWMWRNLLRIMHQKWIIVIVHLFYRNADNYCNQNVYNDNYVILFLKKFIHGQVD